MTTDLSDRLRTADVPHEPLPDLDELWARGVRRRHRRTAARALGGAAAIALVVTGLTRLDPAPRVDLAPAAPQAAETGEPPYYHLGPPTDLAIMDGPALSSAQRRDLLPTYRSRHGDEQGVQRVRLARRLADVVVYVGPGQRPDGGFVCMYVVPDRGSICQPDSQPMALVEPDHDAGVTDVVGLVPDGYTVARAGTVEAPVSRNVFVMRALPRSLDGASITLHGPAGELRFIRLAFSPVP